MARKWNFLIFDDDQEILDMLVDLFEAPKFLGDDVVRCKAVSDFNVAQESAETGNYDLFVLDLHGGSVEQGNSGELSGEKLLATLKQNQFTPVVFHTGFSQKVEHLENSFTKVVRKGNTDHLLLAVQAIFNTKLPDLVKYIQEEQRRYVWEHVGANWDTSSELKEDGEIAYLLARRLASSLSPLSIRKYFNPDYVSDTFVFPIEYYIWPALNGSVQLGDVYHSVKDDSYHLVINPACDFEQGKAESVLFVKCKRVSDFSEFQDARKAKLEAGSVSGGKKKELMGLVGDHRKVSGGQPERYKYLPGTSFIPHLVADFQVLTQVSIDELSDAACFSRLATLDTPFAEGVQAKFSRYYGRFGVPDLNFERIATDLITSM